MHPSAAGRLHLNKSIRPVLHAPAVSLAACMLVASTVICFSGKRCLRPDRASALRMWTSENPGAASSVHISSLSLLLCLNGFAGMAMACCDTNVLLVLGLSCLSTRLLLSVAYGFMHHTYHQSCITLITSLLLNRFARDVLFSPHCSCIALLSRCQRPHATCQQVAVHGANCVCV